MLIADADIDVAEIDDIADVLRGTIVVFVLHECVPSLKWPKSPMATPIAVPAVVRAIAVIIGAVTVVIIWTIIGGGAT
jgi:hypothetical protein